MYRKRDFPVKISKTEVVAPALPVQEHWLPLSNLDLLLPPVDVGVFFCYDSMGGLLFGHMVGVLKKALAETLVSYYAFAGGLVKNAAGEPELLCNNCGVDFVEAFADVELKDINLYNPDESVEGKLVPERKRSVLAVQASIHDLFILYILFIFFLLLHLDKI
ncbi:UNVERIFIED_CONTAM: Benzyl alcohol O-benzoyltransferase [Sesamum latifolium]|uniref:Benzyl alcohol O-benzoyltransferase n=1 Tax=Sesamum latifolium TaxID=2727402 RepID=A0AAW2TRZ6_9LAMI